MDSLLENLVKEITKLHQRYELSQTVGSDWFEPGMMEYLDQYKGVFDAETGTFAIRFDVRGTRYEGRTEQIETVKVGEPLRVVRESDNIYNSNNFFLEIRSHFNIGNMPAELCNVIAPLYDSNRLIIESAVVSFVDPLTKRSRYAKQGVLFAEVRGIVV